MLNYNYCMQQGKKWTRTLQRL